MNLSIRRCGQHSLPLPSYAHPGDAGLDLAACLTGAPLRVRNSWGDEVDGATIFTADGRAVISHGWRALIPCGFAFAIPDGFEGQVRPRSGLSLRTGLLVVQGTIDSTYRGEVGIIVVNLGGAPVPIAHGDRIAQLVVAPVARCEVVEVDALGETERGGAGFGSTGR